MNVLSLRVLVFAPHNDDEVLGAGGTIAKYSALGHDVFVCEVTKGDSEEVVNVIRSEALDAHKILGIKETIFLDFPVVQLRETPLKDINSELLKVVNYVKPHVAFIPHKGDIHIDHAVVSNSAMVALRPINNINTNAIYAYETLSETEWNIPTVDNAFIPNVWSDISQTIQLKVDAMNCFKTQLKDYPHPRSIEAIIALSKFRGSTICVNYAESFMLIRDII